MKQVTKTHKKEKWRWFRIKVKKSTHLKDHFKLESEWLNEFSQQPLFHIKFWLLHVLPMWHLNSLSFSHFCFQCFHTLLFVVRSSFWHLLWTNNHNHTLGFSFFLIYLFFWLGMALCEFTRGHLHYNLDITLDWPYVAMEGHMLCAPIIDCLQLCDK